MKLFGRYYPNWKPKRRKSAEGKNKNNNNNTWQTICELWDKIKWSTIYIIGIPEREKKHEKKKNRRIILRNNGWKKKKEIMADDFPN